MTAPTPRLRQVSGQARNVSVVHSSTENSNVTLGEDLDSVVLDDKYYKEMGMSPQDIEDQQALTADDIDPEAAEYNLEDLFSPREGTPQEIIDAYFSKDVYGPEV